MEHVGEPLLTELEVTRALEERCRVQESLRRRRREAERGSLATFLKGPGEVGPRCDWSRKFNDLGNAIEVVPTVGGGLKQSQRLEIV